MKLHKILIIFPIKMYQYIISPLLTSHCRFIPTCSSYMIEAIEKYGVLKGIKLGAKRIGKCHPMSDSGYDPVP